MIVATPLKAVMALEPFVGGAAYVTIRDRKHSEVKDLPYEEGTGRLILPGDADTELEEAA